MLRVRIESNCLYFLVMFALEKRKLSAALRKTKSIERYGLYVARALHQKGRPLAVGVSNHTPCTTLDDDKCDPQCADKCDPQLLIVV